MSVATKKLPPAQTSGRLYVVVFLGLVGQLVVQFVLQKLLTSTLGAGGELDAYRVSLTLPMAISAMLAGTVGPVILPVLSKNTERSAIGGLVFSLVLTLALVLAGLCFVFREAVIGTLQPGYDTAMVGTTANVFAILVWLLPANAIIGISQSILNARLNFIIPALAGVLGPLVTVIIYWRYADQGGGEVIAWATLSGAIVNLLIQLPFLFKVLEFRHWQACLPELKRLALLALPILTGMLLFTTMPLVDKFVLSKLEIGSITRYDLAYQFLNAFIMLASGTLSTVAFPRIAKRASSGGEALCREIALALRGLIILVVPAVAVLFVFGEVLIEQMFESGAFLHSDTQVVGQLLRIFAFMIIGASVGELATKTLYALQKTRIPFYISSVMIIGCCIAKIVLVPHYGLNSIALITTLTYLLSSSIHICIIVNIAGSSIFQGNFTTLLTATAASAVSCGIGFLIVQLSLPLSSLWGLIAGAIVYFSIVAVASSELREMVLVILKKEKK